MCTNVQGAVKSVAGCNQLLSGMCAQAEQCNLIGGDLVDQLNDLKKQAADLRVRLHHTRSRPSMEGRA